MAIIRKITSLGTTVKGAVAAYVVPRLAADQKIAPGQLTELLKGVDPKLTYEQQIPLIVKGVKQAFDKKLNKDMDLDDLEEILESLGEEGEDEAVKDPKNPKEAGDEDTDEGGEEGTDKKGKDKKGKDKKGKDAVEEPDDEGAEEAAGTKLMAMLAEQDIAPEDLDAMNELINTMCGGGKGDRMKDKKGKDEFPNKKKDEKEDAVTKPAMDAALAAQKTETQKHLSELFAAAAKVAPIVGQVDTLAFDSAENIYKYALEQDGSIPIKDVHPSAFKSLVEVVLHHPTEPVMVAADASLADDFDKRFPNQPIQA